MAEEREPFERHLKSLWHEGSLEVALSFLRRALSSRNTLSEVLYTLQFEGISAYLNDIRLEDVLLRSAPAARRPTPDAAPKAGPRPAKKGRRRRRSTEEMDQVRAAVLAHLHQSNNLQATTTQICRALGTAGHQVVGSRASLLLKQLEKDGHIVDLGGKPKTWRAAAAASGRRAAEPMVIKKKQPTAAPT